ncbi:Cytochrome b-c1 complex subunit 2, mitochondrial [Trichinella nativa]|uniref:Cytochrome b-c1 complex subunit 2, mitochondrial n=1 Tax=Trichinella nativa TaxID=6335 RepID=A0A0V1L662_9BILA|nr:Cytochrome b-c1 complex subunit 2, mitochondrial [Trichinella nativa]
MISALQHNLKNSWRFYSSLGSFLNQNLALDWKTSESGSQKAPLKNHYNYDLSANRLQSGLMTVNCDIPSPLSYVTLALKAGTRYENLKTRGLVHRLQASIGQETKNCSAVRLSYCLAQLGAQVRTSYTRDCFAFHLVCTRDKLPYALNYFNEAISGTLIYDWTMENTNEQLYVDRQLFYDDPCSYAVDLVHRVAYSTSTLGYSLHCPKWAVSKHSSVQIGSFIANHLTCDGTVVVGVGTDANLLDEFSNEKLKLSNKKQSELPIAVYTGGVLVELSPGKSACVAVAGEGTDIKDTSSIATQLVFSALFGNVNEFSTYSSVTSPLKRAVESVASYEVMGSCFNYFYSDTGLFGVCLKCNPADTDVVLKSAVAELKKLARGRPEEGKLKAAKALVKRKFLDDSENLDYFCSELAYQACSSDGVKFITPASFCKLIDSVSASDLQSVKSGVYQQIVFQTTYGDFLRTNRSDAIHSRIDPLKF